MSVVGVETGESLTAMELSELTHAEAAIERGLASFVEVGEALARVRDGRLYRDQHGTFEAYCRDRWGLTDSHARHLITGAAQTVAIATADPEAPKPANLGQARALSGLPPERAAETMRAASEATGGKVTAAAIADVRHDREDADERPAPRSAGVGEGRADVPVPDDPAPAEGYPQNTSPTIPQGEPVSRAVGGASAPVSSLPPTGGDTGPVPAPAPASVTRLADHRPTPAPSPAPSLAPAPKPVRSGEQQNAEENSRTLASSLIFLLAFQHPTQRDTARIEWETGSEAVAPTTRGYVTPDRMRQAAEGLRLLADEWESTHE